METTETIVRNKLVSQVLTNGQFSVTKIPHMTYENLSRFAGYGQEKILTLPGGPFVKYRQLHTEDKKEQYVYMLYVQQKNGDAVEAKLALLTREPTEAQFRKSYQFEIEASLVSRGWNKIEGNRFVELLSFHTGDTQSVLIDHPIARYSVEAIVEARRLSNIQGAVSQQYIDNAPNAPR